MASCEKDIDCGKGLYCDINSLTCKDYPSSPLPWGIILTIVSTGIITILLYNNIIKRLKEKGDTSWPSVKWIAVGIIVTVIIGVIISILLSKKEPPSCGSQIQCDLGQNAICNPSTNYKWLCVQGLCEYPNQYAANCQTCHTPCPSNRPFFDCASKQCTCDPETPLCGSVCCPSGDCSLDENGNPMCCPSISTCKKPDGSTICCGGGMVCNNGSCVSPCGLKKDGSANICNETETCVIIDGLTPERTQALESQYPDVVINNQTLYMCQSNSQNCSFPIEQRQVAPASIGNFYPAFLLGKSDQTTGLGFCSGSDPAACFSNGPTKTDCESLAGCQWHDVLSEASQNMNSLIQEMGNVPGNTSHGYWCGTSEQPFVRVITSPALSNSTGACSWKDCWTQLAQPGVTDLYWNDANLTCTAIQNATYQGGLQNQIQASDGTRYSNKQISPIQINSSNSASPNEWNSTGITQSNCAETLQGGCPSGITPTYMCQPDGTISTPPKPKLYYYHLNQWGSSYVCSETGANTGYPSLLECIKSSPCMPGYSKSSDGMGCYINRPNVWAVGDSCGAFCSGSCSADSGACDNNASWQGGSGQDIAWASTCSGGCCSGSGCSCYCQISPDWGQRGPYVPAGHFYCIDPNNLQWQQCDPNVEGGWCKPFANWPKGNPNFCVKP